ncbi:MAG: MFS transporter [Thermodesulfobacteriaceae bacterium]|jgi:CBS domain-containing protein
MKEQRAEFTQVLPVAIVAWSGALLEWMDFYAYAILAKLLAKTYFPSDDPLASLLAAFAALAVGFLFRPLGALMFGKIGDQFGRKVAFFSAVTMMMVATLAIAILPGYAAWGVLASILLFICRILQGLALGGGFGAAITYLGEFTPDHRRGFITGFLFTTAPLGMALTGNIVSWLQGYFGKEAFEAYGWRWTFVIVALMDLVFAIVIHLFYKETPIFTTLKQIRRVTSSPIKDLFTNKHYVWLFILAWIGVIGAHGPIWYTNQLYVSFYMQHFGVSAGDASKILAYATYIAIWLYPFFGWVSDKVGRRPILLIGIFGNALMFPIVFHVMKDYFNPPDFSMLLFLTATLTCFNAVGYSGAMSAFVLELFPARIRTTAISFTYNMGYGVTGGLTPFMITLIQKYTGDVYTAIIIWSTCVPMLMGLLFLLKGWETKGERIWEELSAGKFAQKAMIVSSNEPLGEVMKRMQVEGQRMAVVAEHGKYRGMIEERIILKALANGKSITTPVKEVMAQVDAVLPSARIIDAVALLQDYGLKGIAVATEQGNVIGVIDPRYVFNEVALLTAGLKKGYAERVRVEEFMHSPITVTDTTKVADALKTMVENNIGFLPVISAETGKLVGVISEKDLMAVLCCEPQNAEKPVSEFMTKNVITITSESTLKEALEKFIDHKIRHLPVVRDSRVVGVISVKDVIKLV